MIHRTKRIVIVLSISFYAFNSSSCVPPPPPPQLQLPYFTILVDAFDNPTDAKLLFCELRRKRINNKVIPQNGYFYVTVGKFKVRCALEDDLVKIRKKGFDAEIIPDEL